MTDAARYQTRPALTYLGPGTSEQTECSFSAHIVTEKKHEDNLNVSSRLWTSSLFSPSLLKTDGRLCS